MLLKLAAYGTLAYVGFKYLQSTGVALGKGTKPSELRIAGGPLSDQATLLHSADEPGASRDPQEAANPT